MKSLYCILIPGLLTLSSLCHGENLEFKEAVNMARDNNPSIRQMRLRHDSAQWEKTKAMASFMPKLTLHGQHLTDEKFQTMPITFGGVNTQFPVMMPLTEFDLRATYTLFEGFAGMNQLAAARLQEQASELELSRAEFQLEREVRYRFFQALGAQTLQEVAAQRVKNLEEHLGTSKRYVQNGVTTNYDVLRIEVQLADARADQLQAEDNVVLAKNRLAQTLGVSSLAQTLTGSFPDLEKIIIPTAFDEASQQRDDIQAKMLREESARKTAQAAKAWWSPKVGVFAEKQFYNYMDHDWQYVDKYNDAYFIGFNLNWDLFDGGSSRASQRQANNQARIEAENSRAAVLQVPQEFELWKRKYLHSVSIYRSTSLSITKAQEAVRQATIGRRAGTRTINDVLDTELELNQTKAKMVQAQIDAIEALGNLELASGKTLF